jgi:hypothetical protein
MTKSVNPHILLFDWLIKVISEILPPLPKSLFLWDHVPRVLGISSNGIGRTAGMDFSGSPKTSERHIITCKHGRGGVRQPYCDERGVGFAVHFAENSTLLWSHHSVLGSDETWLSEWSDGLGGVQRWRSSVAWGSLRHSEFI